MNEQHFITDIETVAEHAKGTIIRQGSGLSLEGLSTDSRYNMAGMLFVPLEGETYDGHDFIPEAISRGAAAVLLKRGNETRIENLPEDIAVVAVDDTLRALGDIAHHWRQQFDFPVIAVTGSSGKTTTKEMIASIGGRSLNMMKSLGNFNNLIGLPLSLLNMGSQHGAGVFELGSNAAGEIARLTEIADPDIAVITNVGSAHLEGFKSIDAVREEKGALFAGLKGDGVAVINRDDRNIRVLEDRWRGKSVTFGITENALVGADHFFSRGDQGVSFTLKIGGLTRGIDMTTLGVHNIYNALAAAAACWACGISFDEICDGLSTFCQLPGRMNLYRLSNGAVLIDDTYNANPASAEEALRTLNDIRGNGDSIAVFGDMLELGDQAVLHHQAIGELIAATEVRQLLITGEYAEAVATGARRRGMSDRQITYVTSPEAMISGIGSMIGDGWWILVKGSRRMRMEQYVQAVIDTIGLEREPVSIRNDEVRS